ncbi:MAG: carbohydrate ABC transporter permease [Chloroflexi bacterium]|nr:carbohydrate ABC transporter permease [Chloroflexota bacterium]
MSDQETAQTPELAPTQRVSDEPQVVEGRTSWDDTRFYINKVLFWLLVAAIAIYTMAPFAYAISISFRTNAQVLTSARYLPEDPQLTNYQNLLGDSGFMNTMVNSAIVSTVSVTISLIVGSFAAYALGRVRFRGRMVILYLVLAMTMFPQISILSGLFSIVNSLDINGSVVALIFSYPIFTLPFTVWVLTSFFQGLPAEIEQAALVDGATAFQTFWRILVPLTAPALVTTGLLAFIAAWNEYLFALTFTLVDPGSQTVPVAIANFSGFSFEIPIADKIAAAVVVTVPLLILVLIFQRRIIEGLTAGAVKG